MLRRWLLLSALAHAAVLTAVAPAPPEWPRLLAPELQVSIATPTAKPLQRATAQPLRAPQATPQPSPQRAARRVPAPRRRMPAAAAKETAPAKRAHSEPASRPAQVAKTVSPPNQLLALLHARLQEYFVYPPLARKRGWQGEVRIDIRVEADGRINPLRVVRSSGHSVLDRDALSTLNRLGALPQARNLLRGHSYAFELPVSYRLTEG